MTPEEAYLFYEARQRYREKCQDFKEQEAHYLEHYKPRHYGKEQRTQAHL